MDGGMASYTGAAGVGAVEGAGSDAASAAAIDGADILTCNGGLLLRVRCLEIFELSPSSSRVLGDLESFRPTTRTTLAPDDRLNCLLQYMNEEVLSPFGN